MLRLGRNVGVYERERTTQQEIVSAITSVFRRRSPPPRGARDRSDISEVVVDSTEPDTVREVIRRRYELLKSGDVGSLPVVVGVILITIYFTSKASVFFTAVNFDNLIPQMAQVTVMAIGVVFVLLMARSTCRSAI